MVLGKLPVPGRSSNLADSRARAYCACIGCGWGLFGHFYSHLFCLSSFLPPFGRRPDIAEILSQRTVKPKTTNQPNRQILLDTHIEIKRRFCKHDWNLMNSGVNSITIASLSDSMHVSSFQPIIVGCRFKKGLKIVHDITLF